MQFEFNDDEVSDLREALRMQLDGMLRELARADERVFRDRLRERYERLEKVYQRLDQADVTHAPH
jgi:hypothetical protein